MKTLFLALLIGAAIVPTAASAQTRELARDRQDIRKEQRELNRAYRSGDPRRIRDERGDLREARRQYREDWRDYRRSNPRIYYRAGWRAPFRYNRFAVGARIAPAYWGPRYVIGDPYRYRLPRPYAGSRWVRHYDDVLLINVRTGRVRQVIRGFYF
jgi:Ni/Co efflux regulator RcnB